MLKLGCHQFNAVVFLVPLLNHLTFVATLDSKLTACLMLREVLLEHLCITAIISALKHSVPAFMLMLGQISVG